MRETENPVPTFPFQLTPLIRLVRQHADEPEVRHTEGHSGVTRSTGRDDLTRRDTDSTLSNIFRTSASDFNLSSRPDQSIALFVLHLVMCRALKIIGHDDQSVPG